MNETVLLPVIIKPDAGDIQVTTGFVVSIVKVIQVVLPKEFESTNV